MTTASEGAGLIDKLKGRLDSMDPLPKKVDLVGSCATRLMETAYQMEQNTDIDILCVYDISRRDFRKEKGLDEDAPIEKLKAEVDDEIGPIEGYKVDCYVIYGNNESKYEETWKENEGMMEGNSRPFRIY